MSGTLFCCTAGRQRKGFLPAGMEKETWLKRDAPAGVPSMVLRSLWGNYWFCSGLSSSNRVLAEAAKPASP